VSIKVGSWFQQSNFFQEILLITYDIVCRVQARQIQREYRLSAHTVSVWGMFCRETTLVFLAGCFVKIGGPQNTVEIDESMFGRPKYHRGHPINGQWVFGGVERESGRTFLVPMLDRTADTLMAIIVTGSNPALRLSVIAGVRTAILVLKLTRTAPLITASTSSIL
jgi:hypothetical protein